MDLQNKVITIVSTETKLTNTGKTMIKIKDQNNLTYQIWQLKQDGSESVAYQGLQNLGEPVGKTIEIGYKEDQGDFQGKAITYRTIVNIKPTDRQPSKGDMYVKAQMVEAKKEKDDKKWEELGWKKCKYGFLIESYRLGLNLKEVEKTAELWADACQRDTREKTEQDLEDGIPLEEIPFN